MRIYYDTEFIDGGKTIELISIGMVSEKGEEFYGVNGELHLSRLLDPEHAWHMENTVPTLPIGHTGQNKLVWSLDHPDTKRILSRAKLRQEIFQFLLDQLDYPNREIELWAWYAAYDHVALAQLWGPMNNLPGLVPQYTNDLKQELERKIKATGNRRLRYDLPKMEGGNLHNALDDARLLKKRAEWLAKWVG